MEFRIATATDFDSVKRLWAYAFNGDEPFASWYFSGFTIRIMPWAAGGTANCWLCCTCILTSFIFAAVLLTLLTLSG